ncbi:MAG: hypothetical protein NZ954_01890 [Thermofilaceae archaeon]|nr:hypothetical protein [Thermofilaceae archaeon]MDW8003423.1 hypothetical protein [Thermofilaceae archaeon]
MDVETLVLIGVAIAMAFAASFWVVNISTSFFGLELLEVKCSAERSSSGTVVLVSLKNKGNRAVTIVGAVVNGEVKPINLSIEPSEYVEVRFDAREAYTVQVVMKTVGREYPCITAVKG